MGEKEWRSLSLYDELTPVHENVRQFFRRTDGMRCVLIPPALVELGSTAPDSLPDQGPRHTANLAGFLIDAEPVSTTAYARFLNSTGASPEAEKTWCGVDSDDRRKVHFQLERNGKMWRPKPGTERQPIVLVSWFGATAYSLWANRREWKESAPFLPTEAQWEYAARGAKWQLFPWGSDPCMPDRAVVGLHTARAKYSNLLPLADVSAELGLSPFGLRHMAGNVWNWCRDWYAPDFYRNPEATGHNPEQPKNTGIRSERGGSWIGPGALAASSYRRGRPPHARGRCLGFRCIGHPPDMARR
jgi:formylglycine-generating enzyme required for sulfatase activity